MRFLSVVILAIVQGLVELLPVSSSAHVVVAEKLMGIDPSNPEVTLLLVMLHAGTMAAVIVYFWKRWNKNISTASRSSEVRAAMLANVPVGESPIGGSSQFHRS